MRAAEIRRPAGLDKIVIADRPMPAPGPGEILVRPAAGSLNYHDYAVVAGLIPVADGRVLLSDGAGEVAAVGAGVKAFRPGDRVMSCFFPRWESGTGTVARRSGVPGDHVDGFAADYVVCRQDAVTRIPKGYSLAEAATLPCAALTAWHALMVFGRIKPGDVVLVQGSGGVSIFALQFAKAAGATVIATTSSADKARRLMELGADQVINYVETPDWGTAATDRTGGEGVDLVIELGGGGTLNQSIEAARTGGRIALIGILTGMTGDNIATATLMRKNLTLTGITVGSREDQQAMVRAIEATGIRPVIDRHFVLEDLAAAFAHQAAGRHFGKIVIDIGA